MDFETILYETDGAVATITLNRPDRMNAISWRMLRELSDAMRTADGDDSVRAVVLTGAGDTFCAGADMGGGEETFRSGEGVSTATPDEMQPWQCRKPVIAAINGHAVGGGLTYPMMCDVRLVAQKAKLGFVFVRRGLIPELGSHTILPAVVGLSNAADLLLTGRIFLGTEAAEMGLASRALPADEVLPAALGMARDIADNASPAAVAMSKSLLWQGLGTDVSSMQQLEEKRFFWAASQPDASEGVTAFLERRPPRWSADLDSIPDFEGGR